MQIYIFLDEYWKKNYIFSDDQRCKKLHFSERTDVVVNRKRACQTIGKPSLFIRDSINPGPLSGL